MKYWQTFTLFVALTALANYSVPASAAQKAGKGANITSSDSIVLKTGKTVDGTKILKNMEKKFKNSNSYVFGSELTTYKRGKRIKQSGKFYYKDPNLVRFEVIKGGFKSGSVVVRQPNGKIKGKSGGIFGKIVVNLSPNSKLLKTANGFNVLKADFETLIKDALKKIKPGKKCVATASPYSLPGKGKTLIVEVLNKLKKVEQRVVVDPKSRLPLQWILFRNTKILSVTNFSSINLNAKIPTSVFVLDKSGVLAAAKAIHGSEALGVDATIDTTHLNEDTLDWVKKLNKTMRRQAKLIGDINKKESLSDSDLRDRFVIATNMEVLLDDLRTLTPKLKELDDQEALSNKWRTFTDKIGVRIGNVIELLLYQEKVDKKAVQMETIKIEQLTRSLDNIVFSAKQNL